MSLNRRCLVPVLRLPTLLGIAVLAATVTTGHAQQQFTNFFGPIPTHSDASHSVVLGDVDADGDLDMVFGNMSARNRLYLNDGTGVFSDATPAQLPLDTDDTLALELADVDGDGDLDLVLGNGFIGGQQNRLYLNDGNGSFTDVTAARMPADNAWTTDVVLADVDGDGDRDIVFANANGAQGVGLYLNDGAGNFTDVSAARIPANGDQTWGVALGDADGDGDLDMAVATDAQNRLYLNDGAGSFADVTAARLPVRLRDTLAALFGDVDGDGDQDLIFGEDDVFGSGQNQLYLNDGAGTFSDATAGRMPVMIDDTHSISLIDTDGDGDLDLVFGNRFARSRLCLNDGSGNFTEVSVERMPAAPFVRDMDLGDLDGDGDPDIAVAVDGLVNRIYVNLLRQLRAPVAPRIGAVYEIVAYARYGNAGVGDLVYPFLALGSARIPLPPLGTVFLSPTFVLPLPPSVIPQPDGVVGIVFSVPNISGLVGTTLHAQAVILQSPGLARLTNLAARQIVE